MKLVFSPIMKDKFKGFYNNEFYSTTKNKRKDVISLQLGIGRTKVLFRGVIFPKGLD